MKNLVRFLAVCVALTAGSASAQNQALSPLRPEQDPCNAITFCPPIFATDSSYTGPGFVSTPGACLTESNSLWLRVDVVTSGNIVFTITPANATNDYDFAVYQSTNCNALGAPIRCNANNNNPGSNINGQVGLNTTSFLTNVVGGTFGNSYLAQINAIAPATYYILIDNASPGYFPPPPIDGFSIDFTGSTAGFAGSAPPLYDSIPQSCNNTQSITVYMDRPVQCSSIAANGSDFTLTPALGTVAAAAGIGCTSGTATGINLTFSAPLPPGTYTLKPQVGSDGNTLLNVCNFAQPLTDSIVFEVVAPITVSAGPDTNICLGQTTVLAGSFTGGGGVNTIAWTPTTGLSNPAILNPTAAPATNQTYTLTVTPDGLPACAVTDVVTVGVLQGFAILTPPTTLCRGQSVNINVNGDPRYTYTWTPAAGLSSTTTANTVATPDSTTGYTLTATYPGCTPASQAITITVEPVPVVNAGRDTVLCYGLPLQLAPTVTPAFNSYTYSWTPATVFDFPTSLAPRFVGFDTVTATLTVTTPNGCTGKDSLVISVVPKLFGELSADTGICPRDSAQLVAGGGVHYLWSPARGLSSDTVAAPLASPVTSTIYTVEVINSIGCRDTQSVEVIIYPAAVVELPDSVRIHPGEVYQMDPRGNCSYFKWFPPYGLTADSIANPVASPEVNTRYFVTASTTLGCTAALDSIDVYVDGESFIAVPNAFTPGREPNALLRPERRGLVSINYFRVYNRWGQKVYETNVVDQGWDGRVNGTLQPLGVYIWEVDAMTSAGRRVHKQGNTTLLR